MANRTDIEKNIEKTLGGIDASLTPVTTIIFDGTTTEHTGPFYALTALEDAVIDVDQCTTNINESDGASAIQIVANNITIPRGITIYGNFTSIELDSGTVIAYSKPGTIITVE